MPAAVKLQEEYGDDIQVIFVESQNSGYEKSVGMAAKSGWLGNQAIWTNDYIFSTGGNGLPSFALLDGEGKVVLKGSSNSMHGAIEEELERMVKAKNDPPAGVPSKVAKVYANISKGNFAKAKVDAGKVLAKPGSKDTDAVVAAAEAALTEIDKRFAANMHRAEWLLQNGYPLRAKAMVEGLAKGVKGDAEMSASVADFKNALASEEHKAAFSAAKELAKIETELYEDGGSKKLVKKLDEIAADNSGTPIAKRAKGLVDVAQYSQM